jgi:hypothetical protein
MEIRETAGRVFIDNKRSSRQEIPQELRVPAVRSIRDSSMRGPLSDDDDTNYCSWTVMQLTEELQFGTFL